MVSNAKFKMNGIWHSWHSCQNEEDYKKNRIYFLGFFTTFRSWAPKPWYRGTFKIFSKFTICFFNSFCGISYFYIFKSKMHRDNVKKGLNSDIWFSRAWMNPMNSTLTSTNVSSSVWQTDAAGKPFNRTTPFSQS